jgi:hypothetical protein
MKCESCGGETGHLELDKWSMKLICKECLDHVGQPLED